DAIPFATIDARTTGTASVARRKRPSTHPPSSAEERASGANQAAKVAIRAATAKPASPRMISCRRSEIGGMATFLARAPQLATGPILDHGERFEQRPGISRRGRLVHEVSVDLSPGCGGEALRPRRQGIFGVVLEPQSDVAPGRSE